MNTYRFLIMLLYSAAWLTGCNTTVNNDTSEKAMTLSLQFIDSTVKPGDDFYLFANGKWLDTAKINSTESRAGARLEMDYQTRANIKSILEEASVAKSVQGSIEQKIGHFYASGMDTTSIEKAGFDPVKPFLQKTAELKNIKEMMQVVAEQNTYDFYTPIGAFVTPDAKNSSKNLLLFYQTGLGLPDRDYYFKNDPAIISVVNAYKEYIHTLFRLTGDDSVTASKNANQVYKIEKLLAESHRTNVEMRDPETNYNKMSVDELDHKMPAIGWKDLLRNLHVVTDSINLSQPGYYARLNKLLQSIPLDEWKAYLRFHLLDNVAPVLSNEFVLAHFEFTYKTLSGQKQLKPRWERIYWMIDVLMGEALGELYVKKHFSEEAKHRITELVNNLQRAFETRINNLDWMSDSTKLKAKEKLNRFSKKVAYPEKWRDYSKVTIDINSYFNNFMNCSQFIYDFRITKIGKPVDHTEWGMNPQTNNAYFNPSANEIVFPAGILQFPMFDLKSDDALNYGGIGVVIGHEMTHGFDDMGAQYNKDGNLENWWYKEDFTKFTTKGEQVISFYNKFTVFDSIHLNGSLTQGENTADMGGVAIAYDAFKLTKQGQDTVKIDGFSPDQRFFLSFAQSWRKKVQDESLLQQINTDSHSPGNYRVIGPLMHFKPFYEAFNVKEGDKMFIPSEKRISIW